MNVTLSIYGNQDEKRVRSTMRQAELFPFEDTDDFALLTMPTFEDKQKRA